MTDEVEATLASLERRLRALQSELDADDAPAAEWRAPAEPLRVEEPPLRVEEPPLRPEEPLREEPPPPVPPPAAAVDALDRFGAELRRLVDAWERTVADLRGNSAEQLVFRGGVALEAQGELRDLCTLEAALRRIPGVASVALRAYAGGAAALEVGLDRDVALVGELRRSLAFDVVEASGNRLTIVLG